MLRASHRSGRGGLLVRRSRVVTAAGRSDRGTSLTRSKSMALSRRDVLKLGALGAVGAAAGTLPFGRSVSAGNVSLLSSSNFPRVYQNAFKPLERLPYTSGVDSDGAP